MEELSMCRICLSTNKRMHNLVGTYLQKMYEDLTTMLFVTKDNRPIMVCYICCARLKNSYQLKMRCLQSEKLFTQVLANNVTVPDIQEDTISADTLQITPVIHLSIGNVQDSVLYSAEKEIKEEVPEVEVIVKREVSEEPQDYVDESFQEYYITLEDNILPMDSYDLITLNAEPEKSRLAAQSVDCEESPHTPDISEDNSKSNESIMCTSEDIKNKVNRYKNNKKKKTYLSQYNKHTGEEKHECDICYKFFSSDKNLQRHIRTHICNRNYKCNICKKKFICNDHLNRHIRVHTGEKPYECEACKKKYSAKSTLKRHIFLIHTKNPISNNKFNTVSKVYTCDICNREFTLKGRIKIHMRTHTGEKPYKCNVCKKAFSEQSTLNKHVPIHSDEKPFQCDKCDKGFKRKSHLDTHIRTHSGDRPYKCDMCKKVFSQKGHLTEHMRVHTGEKPFSCDFCDYSFSHKNCLNRHVMRAHDVGRRNR